MPNNQFFSLLLPPQNPQNKISPGEAGKWQAQAAIAFREIADSLELRSTGNEQKTVSSIPDMWARPLLVEMILRDEYHPLHQKIKAEWKGMLAAIALAQVQGLNLKAQFLKLSDDKYKQDPFVQGLRDLIPDAQHSLYQLDDRNQNPWEHLYIFLLEGKAVGMTSPATLICSAESADWSKIPWGTSGQLQSPIQPNDYLTADEKTQLWYWLRDLLTELNQHSGNSVIIQGTIAKFQEELANSLGSNPPIEKQRPRSARQYFGVPLVGGALKALDKQIVPQPRPSSVQLMPRIQVAGTQVLFIPDSEELTRQWSYQAAKDIWIADGNLQGFNRDEFLRNYKGEYLTEADLFLADFYFIKGDSQLPGAQLPQGTADLTYIVDNSEERLTPLLPINPKLLNYFSATELNEILELQPVVIESQSGVRVTIKLPLSGGTYQVTKDYAIAAENAVEIIPFLELWPNFVVTPELPQWSEYYAFYKDDRINKDDLSFQVKFPQGVAQVHPPELVDFQITRLTEFPSYLICQNEHQHQSEPKGHQSEPKKVILLGVILLKVPPKVGVEDPNKTWRVGVDFGTSFTHVYYKPNRGEPQPLTWSPLLLQVTETSGAARIGNLYKYFTPPRGQNFPLATVLTTLGNKGTANPVFDGRIYIPEDIYKFNPQENHIETDLKWQAEDIPYKELFLKHLALVIAAEAANNHVRAIEWTISYPTAFSGKHKSIYRGKWDQIIQDLANKTGIAHQWLPTVKGRYYRTESVTLAHYFESEERQSFAYTTCIDLGGGTTDISVWIGDRIVHQCSVELGGKLLFSQFMKRKPKFLKEQFGLGISDSDSKGESKAAERLYALLDGVLLAEGEKWLKAKRSFLEDDPELQEIVQGAAIGIAGLYYYVGIILQGLYLEEKSKEQKVTPVLIGGNGSRLLHWLDDSGQFSNASEVNKLLRRMLSKGSGFPATGEDTRLSEKPKAEVACGLVADQNQKNTKLKGMEAEDENEVFAGEECVVNGQPVGAYERIRLPDQVNNFEVPELGTLQAFLEDFHQALKDLRITSITPLKEYKSQPSSQSSQSQDKLWEKIKEKVDVDLKRIQGSREDISSGEPPFVLGLKWLLYFLARREEWEQRDRDNDY